MYQTGIVTPISSFTRPDNATQYADGDLVANHATAGSVVPLEWPAVSAPGKRGLIRRVHIYKSDTDLVGATFLVHFYLASPTPANGDNGAWSTNGVAGYLGNIAVTMNQSLTDGDWGVGVAAVNADLVFNATSGQGKVYGLLEVTGTYTPAAEEVFTVRPEVWRL